MCARIGRAFVLIIAVAFSALGGCGQTTDPEAGVSTPIGIAHLSIGPMEIEALVNVDDSQTVAAVLALLSEEDVHVLKGGIVLHVQDPSLALKVAKASGLDTSNPATTEGGVLLADCDMTWGQLKCCYGGGAECCCPKKKEQ